MNCKPGDLAIVVKDRSGGEFLGRLVEVIRAAPIGTPFVLPNGVSHATLTGEEHYWVLRSLGTRFPHAHGDGMYGCGRDSGLYPLNGNEVSQARDSRKRLEAQS